MTVRNLDRLFQPASVALIGASDEPSTVGAVLERNLRDGGFAGPIMLVNPKHAQIEAQPLPSRCREPAGDAEPDERTDLRRSSGYEAGGARIAIPARGPA